jgi:Histidine kinase-like ATPase domain
VTTCVNTFFRAQFRVVDGLKAFAGRAGRELLATGETARERSVETAGRLAARQAQTARLAWDGRASSEISTGLFTGPCPARWHPGKMRSSEPSGLRSFGHAYPGRPEQVKRVRADLRAILGGCPVADEAILVASELAANAVIHSSSRQDGGRFIVRAEVRAGDCVRVEVEDQGDTWAGHRHRDGRPHGLDIVQAIAGYGNWGIDDAALGHVAWAQLGWPGP